MGSQLSDILIRYRYLFLLISLSLTVSSYFGLKQLVFDASPRGYFEEDYQPYLDFEEIEATYGKDFRVFFMLAFVDEGVFTSNNLAILEDFSNDAWLLPYASRVDSLSSFQHTHSVGDELYVEPLVENAKNYSPERVANRKQIALADESIVNLLVSEDGKYASVTVALGVLDGSDRAKDHELAEAAYALQERYEEQYPELKVYVTGNIMSNYHNVKIAVRDIAVMVPTMFALMFIMLGLLMRTISGVVVAVVVAVLATFTAVGTAAGMGLVFSMLAMNAVMISITVAIAHCIHILGHFFHAYATLDKQAALKESLSVNFFPVTITSLTTALGFLSLNFSDLPPAQSLGNAAAAGALMAWVYAMTVLPALVLLLPFKRRPAESQRLQGIMLSLSDWVIVKRRGLLIGTSLLTALMIFLSFQNTLNDRFSEMISEPYIFREHNDKIDQHFGGLYNVHFNMDSGEEGGIANPEYLKAMDKLTQWLRTQPEVASISALSDVVKRLNRSMHGDDPAYYTIPDDRALIAQYLLLYEMSLPYGLDLNNQISVDKQKSRMTMTYPSTDTGKVFEIERRILDWQQANLPERYHTEMSAMSLIWSYLSRDSLISGIEGAFIALLIISAVLMLMMRSVKYGLISLLPNILPAAFGFGTWYLMNGEIGMSLTCVIIITIGIVVDDTVHFLSKYRYARAQLDNGPEDAVRYAFKHVGSALWITTLVLVSGFMVLTLSSLVANSALGELTATILAAALLLDLLFLPPLLLWLDRDKSQSV